MQIEEILFDEKTIEEKINELAVAISKDYAGKEVVLISVLKGAVAFTADLMRRIDLPVTLEFISASSYGNRTVSSNKVSLEEDIRTDLEGRHVLIVDTIVDTGRTLDRIFRELSERGAASIEAAVLLDKKSRRSVRVPLRYIGFEIPDFFVVGYGMDYGQNCRNLPYIGRVRTDR